MFSKIIKIFRDNFVENIGKFLISIHLWGRGGGALENKIEHWENLCLKETSKFSIIFEHNLNND